MIVTFCGHGSVADKNEVKKWLCTITEHLVLKGARIFYLGGYGEFDNLARSIISECKKNHSHIEVVLILSYLTNSVDETDYCYTIYPPLEAIPKRFAILKRNEWMVEQADIVVAYVTHGWGGAAKTLACAKRKNKQIILYPANEKTENGGRKRE